MKVILINRKHGGSRSIELGRWSCALLSLCCLGFAGLGYLAGMDAEPRSLRGATLDSLQDEVESQEESLADLREDAQRSLQAMTLNLAELQARLTRLDALGEHLTAMAGLEDGEFDISQPPALGGPMADALGMELQRLDLSTGLKSLDDKISDREKQLGVLESMLSNRNLDAQAWLSGRPVEKGWISSPFGQRTDPFTGNPAMHYGVDLAGKEGSNIIAVAGGIVTQTGEQTGYGQYVELAHGDGFVTRYAHNKTNLVEPGDFVRKGEPIAIMGSTGRSTGPHVHFEVYKHGRAVDPASYMRRTRR